MGYIYFSQLSIGNSRAPTKVWFFFVLDLGLFEGFCFVFGLNCPKPPRHQVVFRKVGVNDILLEGRIFNRGGANE